MTRESKIGLLVGLGFVIVIGILLSEQVTTGTEPARASLDAAASSVRAASAAPGAGVDPASAEAAALAAGSGRSFGPSGVVPTSGELATEPRPAFDAAPARSFAPLGTVVVSPPVAAAVERSAPAAGAAAGRGPDAWDALAAKFDGPAGGSPAVVRAEAGPPVVASSPDALFVPAGPPASAGARRATVVTYVARPGDSLGRLAAQALGADTAANRAAIQALNPTLAANPDLLVVGVAYRLPAPPPTRYTVAVADDRAIAASDRQGDAAPVRGRTYTVQPGDSLWRIAQTQAGGGSAVASIQALNAAVLGGGDTVHPGMVLRLP